MAHFLKPLFLAAALAGGLAACTETRVIRDNTLDAKFSRSMGAGNIQKAGQVGSSSSSFR